MATPYVHRLLAAHPHGSFRVGGYCSGGQLAWEIAHQLLCVGRDVEGVVLIDTLSLNARWLFRGICRLLNATAALPWTGVWRERIRRAAMPIVWNCERQLNEQGPQYLVHAAYSSYLRIVGRKMVVTAPFDRRDVPYFRAMANYLPSKLDCEVLAISCERNAEIFEWSTMPWIRLAPHVRRVIVPAST